MADKYTLKGGEDRAQFAPHPDGQHPMVCVDFLDLGERVRTFPGTAPKLTYSIALVFASGEVNEAGRLHEVSKEFTASMHEKASLRKFLEEWRGKSYTKEQLKQGIPADKLVGVSCLCTVEHKTSEAGRTYANLRGIAPLPKQIPAPVVTGYTRAPFWEERKKKYAEEAARFHADHTRPTDDDSEWEQLPASDDEGVPF